MLGRSSSDVEIEYNKKHSARLLIIIEIRGTPGLLEEAQKGCRVARFSAPSQYHDDNASIMRVIVLSERPVSARFSWASAQKLACGPRGRALGCGHVICIGWAIIGSPHSKSGRSAMHASTSVGRGHQWVAAPRFGSLAFGGCCSLSFSVP